MLTVSVAQLRQNPAPALEAVERGQVLTVTRYRRPVARIVPTSRSGVSGAEVTAALAATPIDNQWLLQLETDRSMDRASDPWETR